QRGVPGRRGPLLRVDLFDIIHKIEPARSRRANIERRENPRLSVRLHACGVIKTGFAQKPDGQGASFGNAAILGGDGRLSDPVLQPSDRFVVSFFDLGLEGVPIPGGTPPWWRASREGSRSYRGVF